jgi:hypothetical protein
VRSSPCRRAGYFSGARAHRVAVGVDFFVEAPAAGDQQSSGRSAPPWTASIANPRPLARVLTGCLDTEADPLGLDREGRAAPTAARRPAAGRHEINAPALCLLHRVRRRRNPRADHPGGDDRWAPAVLVFLKTQITTLAPRPSPTGQAHEAGRLGIPEQKHRVRYARTALDQPHREQRASARCPTKVEEPLRLGRKIWIWEPAFATSRHGLRHRRIWVLSGR